MSEMRTLGNTDMKVVPVGLGCMGFSHAYGAPTQKQEAVRMIFPCLWCPDTETGSSTDDPCGL